MSRTCVCGKTASIKRYAADFCTACFIKGVEKSVKKALRTRPFVRDERIIVRGMVAQHIIKKIIPMPLKIVESDGVEVIQWSEDDVCAVFIERLFGHNAVVPDGVQIFAHVSDADLMMYAQLCGLLFTPRSKPKTWTLFAPLFEKNPDMRRNCARSSRELTL
jgi:hypothetical protein